MVSSIKRWICRKENNVEICIAGYYNEDTVVGRYLKSLKQSYEQFGGAAQAKMTRSPPSFPSHNFTFHFSSLELGKKKSQQAKAAKAAKPSTEFVNPHPMATNNNVITASM